MSRCRAPLDAWCETHCRRHNPSLASDHRMEAHKLSPSMYRTEGVRKRIWGCFPSSALERGRDGGTSLLHGVVPAKNLTFCGTSGQLLAKRMKSDVQRELEHLERRCLARPPTTRFDVAAFWKTAADRAEDALSTPSPESGVTWPRVYVYDTLPDFANDANLSGLSDSSVWGRSIGTPGTDPTRFSRRARDWTA